MSEMWFSEFIPWDRLHGEGAAGKSPSTDGNDSENVLAKLLTKLLSSAEFTVFEDERGRSFVRFRLPRDVWERARPPAGEA